MKKVVYAMSVLILVLSLAVLAGCGSNKPSGKALKSKTIEIVDSEFKPVDVLLHKGGTITWANSDSLQHAVVADDDSFSSGQLSEGEELTHKFTKAEEVPYHCENHPEMKGTIFVEE